MRDSDAMEEALRQIKGWAEAYPVAVFGEADIATARMVLGEVEFSRLHATWARHLLDGILRHCDAGLGTVSSPRPLFVDVAADD